jgi:hypothetical protein
MTTTDLTLDFDLAPLVLRPVDARLSLPERFAQFHADNPHVADALEQLAGQWFAAGNERGSTKAFIERLRWESGIRTRGGEYRLDNSLTAFYSRLLLERRPDWSGRILTRTQRAA